MRIKPAVSALSLLFLLTGVPSIAQQTPDFRSEFKEGEKAAKEGNLDAYLEHMQRALELNTKPMNRPTAMYHIARALALKGEPAKAAGWLDRLWEDKVESLMVSFAWIDPAFNATRSTAEFAALKKKIDSMKVSVTPLSGPVVLIDGAGCSLVASIGPDGTLLVDSGYPQAAKAIRSALDAKSSKTPIRWIVNTHEHEDHVGGNLVLGRGAVIIGHEYLQTALARPQPFMDGVEVPPKSEEAIPSLVMTGSLSLPFNGEKVRIISLPSHTKGDLIVWFTGSKVLHMGDDYFPGATRFIFPGENPRYFFETLGPIVRDLPDDAKVVSGHQPVVSGKDLREIYTKTEAIYTYAKSAVESGKTLDQAKKEAAEGMPADWVEFLYEKLAAK